MPAASFDGFAKVAFSVARQVDGRGLYAGLTLTAKPAPNFKFAWDVVWPEGEGYEDAVREGIIAAIISRYPDSVAAEFRVEAIEWQPVDSCKDAFFIVGREAADAILRLCA